MDKICFILLLLLPVISRAEVKVTIEPSSITRPLDSSISLTCIVAGVPPKLINWIQPEGAKADSLETNGKILHIKKLRKDNQGIYTCKLVGMVGKDFVREETYAEVRIQPTKPYPPTDLKILEMDGDSVSFSWTPGDDGFSKTLYYTMEYRNEDSQWTDIKPDIDAGETNHTVTNLTLENTYIFRITQINTVGRSDPSDQTSPIYLSKPGAAVSFPKIIKVEATSATSAVVLWSMPAFEEVIRGWFVEYRRWDYSVKLAYKSQSVTEDRTKYKPDDVLRSVIDELEEFTTYEVRMYCSNTLGRGSSTRPHNVTTLSAKPSGPPLKVRVTYNNQESKLEVFWVAPLEKDRNGILTGYKVKVYRENPQDTTDVRSDDYEGIRETATFINLDNSSLPVWVAVAASTDKGYGPLSPFMKANKLSTTVVESPSTGSDFLSLLKQPWVLAIFGVLVLITLVMIIVIIWRQQKIKKKKLQQQAHGQPLFHSYHSSMNSSINGRYRDDGPQYEKIPDSRTNTPQGCRSIDGRLFDQRSTPVGERVCVLGGNTRHTNSLLSSQTSLTTTNKLLPQQVSRDHGTLPRGLLPPLLYDDKEHLYSEHTDTSSVPCTNSFIDHRLPPANYRDISLDSQNYTMSQNSSIDDLASTIPSVTYSIPNNNNQGYKVVNPTSNERGTQNPPTNVVPPKAKEQDPNAVKPKVYGNITVKEWREKQKRKAKGEATSDTSLLSSFGRGSTDNVSISASESDGSDIEKYLEEEDPNSPRNSGYIEDDLIDVARMGMSQSPPDNSYLHPNNHHRRHPPHSHPPVAADNIRNPGDDATSIESDVYIQYEGSHPPQQPVRPNIYNLNGGVSEIED